MGEEEGRRKKQVARASTEFEHEHKLELNISSSAELELDILAAEPSSNSQSSARLGSFTPLNRTLNSTKSKST